MQRERPQLVRSKLRFDAYRADVCSGAFTLQESALRQAFSQIRDVGLFGCRSLNRDGTFENVGLLDPRRRAFEDMCVRYGQGRVELSTFQQLIEPGAGLVINSLQNPESQGTNIFNDIGQMFIDGHAYPAGGYPETLEIIVFMGRYEHGFGRHQDPYDTTMFVLDGRKHFVVEAGGLESRFSLRKGQYLRWQSVHPHANRNPAMDWSMTMHFAVGPDERRGVEAGTPVDYVHAQTKFKSFLDVMATPEASQSRSIETMQ